MFNRAKRHGMTQGEADDIRAQIEANELALLEKHKDWYIDVIMGDGSAVHRFGKDGMGIIVRSWIANGVLAIHYVPDDAVNIYTGVIQRGYTLTNIQGWEEGGRYTKPKPRTIPWPA